MLRYIEADSPLKEADIAVLASWIEGRRVFVVYEDSRWAGVYGLVADADTGITEPYTADARQLGVELAMFAIYEPHAIAPLDVVARGEIFWFGDTEDISCLPRSVNELALRGGDPAES